MIIRYLLFCLHYFFCNSLLFQLFRFSKNFIFFYFYLLFLFSFANVVFAIFACLFSILSRLFCYLFSYFLYLFCSIQLYFLFVFPTYLFLYFFSIIYLFLFFVVIKLLFLSWGCHENKLLLFLQVYCDSKQTDNFYSGSKKDVGFFPQWQKVGRTSNTYDFSLNLVYVKFDKKGSYDVFNREDVSI